MMLKGARILAISGIALFGLRGVVAALGPFGMAIFVLLLLGAAVIFERLCVARGRCLIGELACRNGLLTAECVTRILSLQRNEGGRFGEIAVREKCLSGNQVGELLELQAD